MAGNPKRRLTDDCCSTSLPAKRPHTEMTTNRSMVKPGGSGLVSKIFTGQAIAEQFSMKIPNSKAGLIIGTGGKTIKSMQSISGANIRISPWHLFSGVSPTERTVHIEGTKRQIEIAKQLVNRVISEFLPPTQPSCGPIQGQLLPPSQAFYEAKEQVRSIKCPQDLICFYQRILKKLEPTNIFFRSQVSRCFWDCLSLRHKNILRPDILDLDENKVTVSFDDYDCTLEEILDKPTFFWEYEDGVVVGITPFFVKLLRDLVEAVFYLKDQWICHAHISVQSIVFKVDDGTNINAKLKNFEFAKYGGETGINQDLASVADLILTIVSKNLKMLTSYDKIPLKLRSFISMLRNYYRKMDCETMLRHPLLLDAELLYTLCKAGGDQMFFTDMERDYFSERCEMTHFEECHNLTYWHTRILQPDTEKIFREFVFNNHQNGAGVLLRQFRNLLVHVNDERDEYNKVDLMWAFLKLEKLYPNLLCEWYGYENKIPRVVLLYV